jgi:hypothetical protein
VESLLKSEVLIVTQRRETCGLLLPSKLALAELLDRPLLWVGETECATATHLRKRPRTGVFAAGQSDAIARWIEDIFKVREAVPPTPVPDLSNVRLHYQKHWVKLLERLGRS